MCETRLYLSSLMWLEWKWKCKFRDLVFSTDIISGTKPVIDKHVMNDNRWHLGLGIYDTELFNIHGPDIWRRSPEDATITPLGKSVQSSVVWTVREITKSSSTFSATNISSKIVWWLQLHDTIQMKSNYTWINYNHDNIAIRSHIMIYNFVWNLNFGTKFSSIYLAKGKKMFGFSTIIC